MRDASRFFIALCATFGVFPALSAETYYFRLNPGAAGDTPDRSTQSPSLQVLSLDSRPALGTSPSTGFAAPGLVPPVTWSASGLPDGIVLGSDGAFSGSYARTGTYDVTVSARDAGGKTASGTFPLVVLPPPASIAVAAPVGTPVAGLPFSTTVSASEPVGGWRLRDGLPAWLGIDPVSGYVHGTPPLGTASLSFTAVAADAYGREVTGQATYALAQPVLTVQGPTLIVPGDAVSYSLVTNMPSPAFDTVAPTWLTLQGGNLTGVAPDTPGKGTVQATASQEGVSLGAHLDYTIAPVTVSASGQPSSITGGSPLTGRVSASAGAGWTYGLAETSWAGVDPVTGSLTGTAPDGPETRTLTPTASRNGVQVTGSAFTVNVVAGPKIWLKPLYAYRTGAAQASFQVSFTGPSQAVSYGFVGTKPAGLAINATTGVVTVTPGSAEVPSTPFTVKVVDAAGTTTTASSTFRVAQPFSVSYGNVKQKIGSQVALTPVVRNAVGTVSYVFQTGVAYGLGLDANTGKVSGTSSKAVWGASYGISATDSADNAQSTAYFDYEMQPTVTGASGGSSYGQLSGPAALSATDRSEIVLTTGQMLTVTFDAPYPSINSGVVALTTGAASAQVVTDYQSSPGGPWNRYTVANFSANANGTYNIQPNPFFAPTIYALRFTNQSGGGSVFIDAVYLVSQNPRTP